MFKAALCRNRQTNPVRKNHSVSIMAPPDDMFFDTLGRGVLDAASFIALSSCSLVLYLAFFGLWPASTTGHLHLELAKNVPSGGCDGVVAVS